jgi:probable rRNA maturation factor
MIELNNLTRSKINEAALKKTAERVLRGEKSKKKDLSIVFVGPKKSQELNRMYRGKDKPANVLSFANKKESTLSGIEGSSLAEGYLGEIALCPAEIKKDAKKYGMIFEKALAWMLIHGILHVVGYDHESKKEAALMEQKEDIYLKNL